MHTNEQNSMDELFRKGFENEETTPPSAGWAQMESLLDAQQSSNTKKKRPFIWYWAAAAVILPFLMAGFWFSYKGENQSVIAIAPNQPKAVNKVPVEKEVKQPVVIEIPKEKKHSNPDQVFPMDFPKNKNYFAVTKPVDHKNSMSPMDRKVETPRYPTIELQDPPETIVVNSTEKRVDKIFEPAKDKVKSETIALLPASEPNMDEIAIIEFRSGRTQKNEEVAAIEWKAGPKPKLNLGESIARLKSETLENIPTISEARENIIAFLGFRK